MAPASHRISLKSLMYVGYTHPDIDIAHQFLTDFGLIPVKTSSDKIYYRGFGVSPVCYVSKKAAEGSKPQFLGGGWAVDTYEDLEAASKLPGGSPITDADPVIGGQAVTVKDPAGGVIRLHFGHTERAIDRTEEPTKLVFNTWDSKNRKGEFQRFQDGPSYVHKLGHYGYEIHHSVYEETRQWYYDTFTLTATDSIFHPATGKDIMTFIHLDKGKEYVDHHNFFLASGDNTEPEVHHASFEVDDVDSELKGHNYLKKNGWDLVLGVGRHLLGSQLFDYWFDPDSFVVEHYADGDMVNCDNPPQRVAAGPEAISIWAPNVPLGFMTRRKADMQTPAFGGGPPGGPGGPGGPPAGPPEVASK